LRKPTDCLIASSILFLLAIVFVLSSTAQQPGYRGAPASAAQTKNPYSGSSAAAAAGKKLYAQDCAQCHGNNLQGMGPAPALDTANVRHAKPGELFWFITTGKLSSGMPSWSQLPTQQRWQVVTFIESQFNQKSASK
jgi:mono/diheme cytochrome c family protein